MLRFPAPRSPDSSLREAAVCEVTDSWSVMGERWAGPG